MSTQQIFIRLSAPTGTDVNEYPFASNAGISSQNQLSPCPVGGTIRNLRVHAMTALASGTNVLALRNQSGNTALTVTFAAGDTDKADTVHSVTVTAGDRIGWYVTSTAASTDVRYRVTCDWIPTMEGVSLYGFLGSVFPPDPGYSGLYEGDGQLDTITNARSMVGCAGTLVGFGVRASGALSGIQQIELAAYKNGTKQDGSGGTVDTRVTLSATAQETTGTFSLPLAVGDALYVGVDFINSPPDMKSGLVAFQATTANQFNLGANTNGAGNTTATPRYFFAHAPGNNGDFATEGDAELYVGDTALRVTGITLWSENAPGTGKSISATLRKNGADTAIAATIADLATTASGSGSVSFAQGDRFCIKQVASGSPLSTIVPLRWALAIATVAAKQGSAVFGVNTDVTASRAIAFGLDGNANILSTAGKLKVFGNFEVTGTSTGTGITQLTSDVTAGPGSGSQAATIANDAVTYAKMQNVSAASKLLGRGAAGGAGNVEEIALGTGLSMSGTTLNASVGGTLDDLTDVTITTPTTGDALIYNGSAWVNDTAGSASALNDLTDVTITTPATNDVLKYNGSAWVNGTGGSGNVTSTGAVGSEPGSPATGDLYLPNNGFSVQRYSGSVWAPWGPVFPWTAPADGDFAWINQGGASVSATNGGIHLNAPANAGMNIRIRKKAAPTAPYTITVWIAPKLAPENYGFVHVGFRQSSDGKLHHWRLGWNNGWFLAVIRSNDPTSDSASDFAAAWEVAHPVCLRIADNNTNRIFSISSDGVNFIDWYSVARTTFLTADEVFFGADSRTANFPAGVTLLSWKQA